MIYYAFDLLENIDANESPKDYSKLEKVLLNGAPSWSYYSWGGCALCYDEDICERLATPSEQKKERFRKITTQ